MMEKDVAKASDIVGVGFHTLRRLRLGELRISNEKNAKAIIELVKLAIKNAESDIEKASKCKKDLTKILDWI